MALSGERESREGENSAIQNGGRNPSRCQRETLRGLARDDGAAGVRLAVETLRQKSSLQQRDTRPQLWKAVSAGTARRKLSSGDARRRRRRGRGARRRESSSAEEAARRCKGPSMDARPSTTGCVSVKSDGAGKRAAELERGVGCARDSLFSALAALPSAPRWCNGLARRLHREESVSCFVKRRLPQRRPRSEGSQVRRQRERDFLLSTPAMPSAELFFSRIPPNRARRKSV